MSIQERIDAALESLAGAASVTLDDVVNALLEAGHPIGYTKDDLRVLAYLRLNGEPLLDGPVLQMQLATARTRMAKLPMPTVDELVRIAQRAHPSARWDDLMGALEQFAEHQREQGDRHTAQAEALRRERVRRRDAARS